jgi:hypothetical protein
MIELNPETGCPTNDQRSDWADEAAKVFMKATGCDREDVFGDLIANLMHLAEREGFDPLDRVRNGISHWYAEKHAAEDDPLGPEARISIDVMPSGRNEGTYKNLPTYTV